MRQTNTEGGPVPLDLNLLRLFDAVYRSQSVSRAALALNLSQPAASQGLTRLRLQLHDALFVRAGGGVRPTPRADRLAGVVRQALRALEDALSEREHFDPASASLTLRLHLSDIGEASYLPGLLATLQQRSPHIRVQSMPLAHEQIASALDTTVLDFAIGYLPSVQGTKKVALRRDRYAIMLRAGHPLLRPAGRKPGPPRLSDLKKLEVVAVRSHVETLHIAQLLGLTQRLVCAHVLALPAIVRQTDLGAVMPRAIAQGFAAAGGFAIVEAPLPKSDFTVSLHWSERMENDPAHRWVRALLLELFGSAHTVRRQPARSAP